MEIKHILELKRKNDEQMFEAKLQRAKHENRMNTINLGVFILSEQLKSTTIAAFGVDK